MLRIRGGVVSAKRILYDSGPPRGFFTIEVRQGNTRGSTSSGHQREHQRETTGDHLSAKRILYYSGPPKGFFTIEVSQRNTSGSTSSESTNGSTNGGPREATYPPSRFFTIPIRQEDSLLLRSAKGTPAGAPEAGAPTGAPTGDHGRQLIRQAVSLVFRSATRIL